MYTTKRVESQCTNAKIAKKLFGGDATMTRSLLSVINALKAAESIKDIVVQPRFRFHALENKGVKSLKGYFAVDVKSVREPWRVILRPLDESECPYEPCHIDEIAGQVKAIEIKEVSRHYG
jgi:hypothetical protein